ncbi:MAG TPA: choice-of-anchor tandem repeat GloVer-containing protein [Rhizomicrobium sp.]|jgi:uncharacterized repeat protein (TIGR03803 family)|nr:choice-of-anchor tandem repeat GloVer-containing protein [Rhizomicrobium sp.]
MRISHILFRGALLGSTLAVAALITAAGASESRADMERTLAATGKQSSAFQSGAASGFRAMHQPGTYTVMHDFAGGSGDGSDSTAEPTLDSAGNMYGVTDGSGANASGTLFEITSGGTESLLHSFGASGDGTAPDGAVIFDAGGNMYGTTEYGGSASDGTVWELAANGTYSVLHNFDGTDGEFIRGRLIQDKKGNFYGTALFGGASGDGLVFEYSAKGVLTVLHSFDGSDGEFPEHGVVMDKSGNLYGVTAFGGTTGDGTVYEISKKGAFTSLYSFTGGADGDFLYGGLAIDKKGNLYGSTDAGGANGAGTVFTFAPKGTLTTLYSFAGGTDVGSPEGDMLLVGKDLYSAATSGGTGGEGGVYEVTLKGKERVLEDFTESGGDGYSAGVTASGKTLYGTTADGGTDGYGVVFSMKK